MELAVIFSTAFVVGFSGAMMPGPLLTAAITESARRGFIAGPLLVLGHGILEGALVVALALGLAALLTAPAVAPVIAVVGGLFLLYMGWGMARDALAGRVSLAENMSGGRSMTLPEEVDEPLSGNLAGGTGTVPVAAARDGGPPAGGTATEAEVVPAARLYGSGRPPVSGMATSGAAVPPGGTGPDGASTGGMAADTEAVPAGVYGGGGVAAVMATGVPGPASVRRHGLHPVLSGLLLSMSNPYWSLWWATVGLGYITLSLRQGTIGLVSFFSGHILSDLAWYCLVAAAVAGGRRFLSDRPYRGMLVVCGVFLLGLGGYFVYWGLRTFKLI
ncbi:LysE family transporter [Desulfotomaculum copahuensis]|uniref:LysE family transporter n=1 Tax=Desulfotomaculum copahuensis TaxID=1838280 RepID=UPI00098FAEF7|nr:LysE family transporter [Desulfotomaculum copahuensis]